MFSFKLHNFDIYSHILKANTDVTLYFFLYEILIIAVQVCEKKNNKSYGSKFFLLNSLNIK